MSLEEHYEPLLLSGFDSQSASSPLTFIRSFQLRKLDSTIDRIKSGEIEPTEEFCLKNWCTGDVLVLTANQLLELYNQIESESDGYAQINDPYTPEYSSVYLKSQTESGYYSSLKTVALPDPETIPKIKTPLEKVWPWPSAGSEMVDLNVGGHLYQTTLATLLRAPPESRLHRMFSGPWKVAAPRDKEGRIFIDSDGEMFKYIIDHLRHGARIVLPDSTKTKERICNEAKYYKLPHLVAKVLFDIGSDKGPFGLYSVGVIILKSDKAGVQFLLVRSNSGKWLPPKGPLVPGEDAKQKAREHMYMKTNLLLPDEAMFLPTHNAFRYEWQGVVTKYITFYAVSCLPEYGNPKTSESCRWFATKDAKLAVQESMPGLAKAFEKLHYKERNIDILEERFQYDCKLSIVSGDIVDVLCDAIVAPTTIHCTLSGEVGMHLAKIGGSVFQENVRKLEGNIDFGEAAICEGVNSSADYVVLCNPSSNYHGIKASQSAQLGTATAVTNCLKLADNRKLSSTCFPLIGIGMNNLPVHIAIETILLASVSFLKQKPKSIEHVILVLFEKNAIDIFTSSKPKIKLKTQR